MNEDSDKRQVTVGRYLLHRQIARGGMATIHIARLMGDEGFTRIVAAKRLLPEFAEDTEFVAMFMDEARIASKVHHPNVVPVLDLVTTTDEVMLVQEYVHGVPLHLLLRTAHETGRKIPVRIACSIAAQVLAGLHAAHTTVDEMGVSLDIVHRDVSPQNVMVAVDGSARLLDFGVAKASMGAHVTRAGTFKGKLAYSAPEQVCGRPVQQSDVYSLAVVLWELLVGHRMHGIAQGEAELVATIMGGNLPSVTEALANEADWGAIDSDEWKHLSSIEPIVDKGLAVNLADRYRSAAEMEREIAKAVAPASSSEVAEWVKSLGKDFLEGRDKMIAAEEASWRRNFQPQPRASHPHMRRATMSGTLRPATVGEGSHPSNPLNPSHPSAASFLRHVEPSMVRRPRFEIGRGERFVIPTLLVLIALLGIGIVWAIPSRSDAKAARRVETETTAQPATSAPSPAPAPQIRDVTVERPSTAKAAPPITEETPASQNEVASESPAPAREVRSPTPPVERPAVREAPIRRAPLRPAPRPIVKRVEPPDPPSPAPVAAPEAKPVDCNPPYYYEGQKKVFKPNCL